ncbi:MAG: hypothetical protein ABIX28_00850 [Vicinamibacterales bacterium]
MKPTSAHAHGDELTNPGVAHETSDVNVGAILWFAGIVAITTMVCAVIVWGLFNLLESQAAARDPKMSPLAMPAATMPRTTTASPFFGNGPAPQLMTNEPAYLAHQRQLDDTRLQQYGWVDEKTGVTRLPIDQAKKLLVERGLPARAAGSQPWLGTHAPAYGEASGGRTIPDADKPAPAAPPAAAPASAAPHAPETPKAPAPAAAGHGSGH